MHDFAQVEKYIVQLCLNWLVAKHKITLVTTLTHEAFKGHLKNKQTYCLLLGCGNKQAHCISSRSIMRMALIIAAARELHGIPFWEACINQSLW